MFSQPTTYYFANGFLWSVLSLYHYFLEEKFTEKLNMPALNLQAPYEELCEWTINETLTVLHENYSESVANKLKEILESNSDKLMFKWSDKFDIALKENFFLEQNLTKSDTLHIYYCLFLRGVLAHFTDIIQNLDKFAPNYQSIVNSIYALNLFISTQETSVIYDKDIKKQMICFVNELSQEWKETVITTSDAYKPV